MKTMKSFLGICAFSALMASCLSDQDNYQAGFYIEHPTSNSGVNAYFANNPYDSLIFFGYGNWAMEYYQIDGFDNSWVSVPTRKGYGSTIYRQKVSFLPNTTGEGRWAGVKIVDVNHSDAYAPVIFYQYATRGDGSLGIAADVKSITGTDGSQFDFAYDDLHRPTSVSIKKDGSVLSQLNITYSDNDSTMTINDKGEDFKVKYGNDYQPNYLANANDTVGYYSRYDSYGYPINAKYLFNFEHRGLRENSCVTFRFKDTGATLNIDSLHNVDTLYYFWKGERVEKLSLTYGKMDNRYQTVDVNQLVRGVESCDPYLLASLFRYTRSTSIVSRAEGQKDDNEVEYNVTTQLNANKSVKTMTVVSGSETITYTFNY